MPRRSIKSQAITGITTAIHTILFTAPQNINLILQNPFHHRDASGIFLHLMTTNLINTSGLCEYNTRHNFDFACIQLETRNK